MIRIEIAGPDFSLSLMSEISGYADACRVLTRDARRHRMRLQLVDKSRSRAGEVTPLTEL